MDKGKGKGLLLTAAMIVVGIRMWKQLRGKTTTPFNEWAIGTGALFFVLALISEVAAPAAGMLALIVVVAEFVTQGASLTSDISSVVAGTEGNQTGASPFVAMPFAATASTQDVSTAANSNGKVKVSAP